LTVAYKVYANIRGGSLDRGRRMAVGFCITSIFSRFLAISSEISRYQRSHTILYKILSYIIRMKIDAHNQRWKC